MILTGIVAKYASVALPAYKFGTLEHGILTLFAGNFICIF